MEALPFVSTVDFVDVDGKASASKAYATVTCCWDSSRGTFKRVLVDLSRKHPTHLEALCALHDKLITEHGGDHRHDYRALEKRARENDGLSTLLGNAASLFPRLLNSHHLARLQLLRYQLQNQLQSKRQ